MACCRVLSLPPSIRLGAGHDGIVGSTGCTGLEVVVGARGFGAEEEQGYGKEDAGHVVPLTSRLVPLAEPGDGHHAEQEREREEPGKQRE